MSFFDSEVVKSEMTEISHLQEEVYHNVFEFPKMTIEDKIKHVDLLELLLKKQQVLYTRLSLSDDPEAIEMKKRILESASGMGFPSDIDIGIVFNNMSKLLKTMRERIDTTGSDM